MYSLLLVRCCPFFNKRYKDKHGYVKIIVLDNSDNGTC